MHVEYQKFEKLLEHAGLSKKEFAALLDMKPTALTNYSTKPDGVPRHLAIVASLCSAMEDGGLDFRSTIASVATKGRRSSSKRKQGELF